MLNKYPLWKNVLLLVLIQLGFVYAAPNLFPEQPAVQISPTTAMANVDMDTLQTKVNTLIKAVPIHPISEEFAKQTILLRFNNTDTQLRVKDILSAELGDDYTVAVNLLSSTPRWMQAIGALPMKLGLDLRGGVHFALEVDIDNLIVQRMQGLTKSIAKNLQQANIRYTELIPKEKQLDILFRDTMSLDQAKALLQRQFPAFEFTTSIAATHRNQLTAQWTRQGLNSLRQLAIEQTINTLRNRINELGVAEPIVQQQGSNRILVDLPGVQDIARAQQILGGTAFSVGWSSYLADEFNSGRGVGRNVCSWAYSHAKEKAIH